MLFYIQNAFFSSFFLFFVCLWRQLGQLNFVFTDSLFFSSLCFWFLVNFDFGLGLRMINKYFLIGGSNDVSHILYFDINLFSVSQKPKMFCYGFFFWPFDLFILHLVSCQLEKYLLTIRKENGPLRFGL